MLPEHQNARDKPLSFATFNLRTRVSSLAPEHDEEVMESYSILGATGNCGSALLTLLIQTTGARIKVYCRNKDKLVRLIPEVANNTRVEIFTGSILDVDLFAKATYGSRAVFLTASTNDNIPGCHISQDLAHTVIKALEQTKSVTGAEATIPKLVLLSSATIDSWISRKSPWVNAIVRRSAWHVYRDLELAEEFLRSHESWVSCVYIKPGGLSVDLQRGHRLTLDDEESFVSYLDIAASMIEAADDEEGKWENKNVGVVNANGKAKFPPGTPRCIALGLLRYYFPFLHEWLPANTGPA
jgi:putative NADH-flavin reductase